MKQTFAILIALFISVPTFSQICKPAISLYFASGKHVLSGDETESFLQAFKNMEAGEYVIEIYAGTDDVGDEQKNMALSIRRANHAKKVLEKHFPHPIISIRAIGKGELNPTYPNTDEVNKRLNRRVDIMIFPLEEGKLVLKGKRGSEILVAPNFFGTCGICGSNPSIQEYFTEREAGSAGISLLDTAGHGMITGGMVKLDVSCTDEHSDCYSAEIRIPADELDPAMTVWESTNIDGAIRWLNTGLPCRQWRNAYIFDTPCLNHTIGKMRNCDRPAPECGIKVELPFVAGMDFKLKTRLVSWDKFQMDQTYKDSMCYWGIVNHCQDTTVVSMNHKAVHNGIGYSFLGDIDKYMCEKGTKGCYTIPKSAYAIKILESDTIVKLKVPKHAIPYLYIPEIDSTLAIAQAGRNKRKFRFKKPVAHSILRIEEPLSKREKATEIDYIDRKNRYKRRKKVLKVKVRKDDLVGG